MDKVTRSVDEGTAVDIFYLDFAKAFDKVPRRLISKLKEKGVDSLTIKWIEDWLTDRKQKVSIRGSTSTWGDVTSGVPRGTVLGPVLFTIFIDHLQSTSSNLQRIQRDRKRFEERKTKGKCKKHLTPYRGGRRNGTCSSIKKNAK